MAEDVAQLLADRLRLGGRGLGEKLRRARRVLPKAVRREATYLAEAAARAGAPKLAVQLDQARILAAHEACRAYLLPLGRRERAVRLSLAVATGLALTALVTFAAVVTVLVIRGYL